MEENTKENEQSLDLSRIAKFQETFANERDWGQFHTPKNLAMALSVEASELVEIFQWLTAEQSQKIAEDPKKKECVADEISDILFYTLRLANVLKIDINEAFWAKMEKNQEKYPVHLAKGNAKKYSEY